MRCVFLLIDSRHGLKDNDEEIMKMLDETAVHYRIVLTKADKIKAKEREKLEENLKASLKKHPAAYTEVLFTSAHKNNGLDDLRRVTASYVEF